MTKEELAIIQKAFLCRRKILKEVKLPFGWKLIRKETTKQYLHRIAGYGKEDAIEAQKRDIQMGILKRKNEQLKVENYLLKKSIKLQK